MKPKGALRIAALRVALVESAPMRSRRTRGGEVILPYLSLAIAGLVLTVLLARRRSRHALTAVVGTVLGGLAVLGGFSIGILLAPVSLVVLLVAAFQLGRRSTS